MFFEKIGKRKQRKRVKDLVDVLHSDLLSDFEEELKNHRRSRSKRKEQTIQYTTINIKGKLVVVQGLNFKLYGCKFWHRKKCRLSKNTDCKITAHFNFSKIGNSAVIRNCRSRKLRKSLWRHFVKLQIRVFPNFLYLTHFLFQSTNYKE